MNKIEVLRNFISDEVCDNAATIFDSLSDHYWQKPWEKNPVYTSCNLGMSGNSLGATNGGRWRDVQRKEGFSKEKYLENYNKLLKEKIDLNNPLLWDNFKEIYEALRQSLSNHLGKDCVYLPDRCTLPGFQMYGGLVGNFEGRGWHYDDTKQFQSRNLFPGQEPGTQYSITVCLEVPDYATFEYYNGTGGDYYDVDVTDKFACFEHTSVRGDAYLCPDENCPIKHGEAGDMVSLILRKGSCVLQTGRFFHRAGRGYHKSKDERRLTLQGHAVTYGDVIYILW